MKVLGIIAEYNPFHNGHLHHLTVAKEMAQASYCVCVMSGSFLQRGEPALVNKWARTHMALAGGVDLVVELPVVYATSSAQIFAEGAVRLLAATGLVSHLCFGSELGQLPPLAEAAALSLAEPTEVSNLIKQHLDQGLVYPRARAKAYAHYLAAQNCSADQAWNELLANPNNILGIEYLRALQLIKSPIQPLTLKRLQAGHHQLELGSGSITSATGIRTYMWEEKGLKPELKQFLPASTWSVLQAEIQAGRGPLYPDDLFPYLLMKLRTSAPADLAAVVDVAEGLEYRIWEAAQTATSYELLIDKIKTKRYTRTRIQRILFHFLLGLNSTLAKTCQAAGPQYVRVLGFNEQGRTLLRKMQKLKQVPIITKSASMPKSSELALQQFALDVLATNVQALLYPAVQERKAALDYLQSPVYVSKE